MPDSSLVDKEHEGNLDEWDIVIDTNVKALLAADLVVPGMVGEAVVTLSIGSIAGDYAYPGGVLTPASRQGPFRPDSASTWWIPDT